MGGRGGSAWAALLAAEQDLRLCEVCSLLPGKDCGHNQELLSDMLKVMGFLFKSVCLCVCVYMYLSACAHRVQKKASGPLELDFL